jgi:GLPGLI family protein
MRKLLQIGGLLAGLVLGLATPLLAQRTISDARISYTVEMPQEQLQMEAMFAGSSMTQYMRGNQSRIDMNFNVVNYIYLLNAQDETVITLMDNHGDKYLIRTDKKGYEQDTKKYRNTKFTDQSETREIAGFKCRKAIGKMEDGSTFDVYYTLDLVPENKYYNRRFMNLKGIPLEFEIVTKTGSKMKVTATKVDLSPVPASVFDVPRGYREITADELKKIRG